LSWDPSALSRNRPTGGLGAVGLRNCAQVVESYSPQASMDPHLGKRLTQFGRVDLSTGRTLKQSIGHDLVKDGRGVSALAETFFYLPA
jgi:hypothetical protein